MSSPLINCQSLSKSFGSRALFQDLSLSIFAGNQVGLIGLNGSGKSTFLKILAGLEKPDGGVLSFKRGLKLGYLPQTCEFPHKSPSEILLEALSQDERPDYEKEQLVKVWLSKFGFKGNEPEADLLSGGWKKRLGLAKELILSPDVLLLDEPTNHLDLDGVLWLEKFLVKEAPTYLLVSHDRYFLQNMANHVIEIDSLYPRGMFSIAGNYAEFLARKEEFIQGQLQQERSFASKARRETEWLQQGAKARTTKAQARIDNAQEILKTHAQLQMRNRQARAKIDFDGSSRETRKLLVAKNVGKSLSGRTLFQHLDFTLSPGTRIGLMGPNGSGKTTLLKLLTGEIEPDQGTIKRADALKTVYFDQHRNQLPSEMTLREALSPNGDYVTFRGQQIHVNGWCKRFLFSSTLLEMPIGKLSGGERARISIAHFMLQPADLLLLDEPTNDLDIPTLEALEESLIDFPGAVVLITHDRCMLDRICNTLLALGEEEAAFYADYGQWEAAALAKISTAASKPKEKKVEALSPKPKLSFAEKKEYDSIENKISKLEAEVQLLNHRLETTEVATSPQALEDVCKAIGLAETQIEQLYLRWEELEKKMR